MSNLKTRVDLDIRPTAGRIGAEIFGVDLTTDLSDDAVAAIREAWLAYKVVFFRDQFLTHEQHIDFAARFGDVTGAHPLQTTVTDEFPQILAIDSRRYQAAPGATTKKVSYDNGWHSDVTAVINPPAASILRAVTVPPYGGDTQFTNLVAAYDDLPEALKTLADGLRARHSFGAVAKSLAGRHPFAEQATTNELITIHPLVRVHPETGEKALYVSPSFTAADCDLIGLNPVQSRRILDLFYEHIAQPEYTTRFRWEPGSIAFWDNRSTCHLAPSDVAPGFDRVLYRVTIEGDVPVGPDGEQSESISGQPFAAL